VGAIKKIFKVGCYYKKMTLDYIQNGMRFKVNRNQITYIKNKKIIDTWTQPNLNPKALERYVIDRMISLAYLYKEELIRL
jgi:hypothetical protein